MASNSKNCNCDMRGTKGLIAKCDARTKQCDCKRSIQGLRCNECIDMHYNFPYCYKNCKNDLKNMFQKSLNLYSDVMCSLWLFEGRVHKFDL